MDRDTWNQRYAQDAFVYGEAPNSFIKQEIDRLKPGKILFPCEGEGRNAVYAGMKGWGVDAFDFSEEGYKKARRLADKRGVALHNFWIADAESFVVNNGVYDAIGLAYCHISPENRYDFHQNLIKGLKPNGTVIFEAFSVDQLSYNSGGPPVMDRLFTKAAVEEELEGLEFEKLSHEVIYLNEGRYHFGYGSVIRMVGIKRAKSEE